MMARKWVVEWTDELISSVVAMRREGARYKEISAKIGVSPDTISSVLRRRNINADRGERVRSASELAAKRERRNATQRNLRARRAAEAAAAEPAPMLSFFDIRRIDDLVQQRWSLPFAFEEVTGRTYSGGVR